MEKSTLSVPGMWADHHVLAVRDALGKLPGVANVYASAMKRQVDVEFDPKAVSAEAIVKGLAAAGYAPGPLAEAGPAPRNKPEWAINVLRVTATNQADGALSGDFRRY
jgi:copper chaperone CopZ